MNAPPESESPSPNEKLLLRIEALLFAAGKPLSVHDLTQSLGGKVDYREVQTALKQLQHHYRARTTALEVRRAGEAWALQVRGDFLPVAHTVAQTDLARSTLKALALIAYHQPVRQSLLVKMMGEQAYSEVKALRDQGFVRASPRGATLELTTTSKFPEYFGLEAANKTKLKALLEKRLGVQPSVVEASEAPEGNAPAGNDTSASAPTPPSAPEGPTLG
jgi:segregation and condensation protein B